MPAQNNFPSDASHTEFLPARDGIPLQALAPKIKRVVYGLILAVGLVILGILVWQGITAAGNPPDPNDPASKNISHAAVMVNAGILVFREGLEAILVLAALTASLARTDRHYWKPVAIGSGISFLATVITYFVVVAILADINANNNASMLNVQAGTGLLAVAVLMVIMNWFFHKIYWTGWITHHHNRKRNLLEASSSPQSAVYWGLLTIGFTSVYREGFEVVIMLQSWRLLAGQSVVLAGAGIGLALTLMVALLTFAGHYRLPYRKMLILTGVMIGAVLLVMVGENVQEMQQANWLPTHNLPVNFPGWVENWFATFPTWEGLIGQMLALLFVAGTYFGAQYFRVWRPARLRRAAAAQSSGG
ncbi:MAG: iron permease [Phycisphaerae bacterium]|nr:iron permease [Phycisphaerae bacterium]